MRVGLRFTLLYAAVFCASGAVLLVLVNVLAFGPVSSVQPAPGQVPGPPDAAQQRIRQLEDRLAGLEDEQTRRMLAVSLVALLAMAAVSLLLGRALAARVLRPLRTITSATRRITAANLHERLAVPGPDDEVKHLADTVDGLLERLEAAFDAQRRFVANAAHELRTPLTTIRAGLDVATGKPGGAPASTTALAERIRPELDRVERLLEGFLLLARAGYGGAVGDGERVALRPLVVEALAVRAAEVEAAGLVVEVDGGDAAGVEEDAAVHGNADLLARLVRNLVDNAVRHNIEGGWITIATAARKEEVVLNVANGGAVLDAEQVARLGRPFQRLAADRTGEGGADGGLGLGLSIVVAVAEAHGGRARFSARDEGGLAAEVVLPAGRKGSGGMDDAMSGADGMSGTGGGAR